jgi:putative (di)nucleoside polyphosphate hydrolase
MSDRPPEFFRAGVGIVLSNSKGTVLVFERTDVKGAWQFPQGGLNRAEDPESALVRELQEETGIRVELDQIVDRYPEPLAYELPSELRSKKTGRGQTQYWYLVSLGDSDTKIQPPKDGELRNPEWVRFDEAVKRAAPFRKALYQRLSERFCSRLP